jgi:cell division transport system permease protein
MPHSLREALAAFRRTPLLTFLSIVAIGFSLFVIGLFALTTHNIRNAIEQIEERVEVVAYLHEGSGEDEIQLAIQELSQLPEVGQIRFVSKEDALLAAYRDLEEFREVYSELDSNPLPASLEVQLHSGMRHPASVEVVAAHLQAYPFVEDVRFGREWLDKIVSLRRVAGGAAAIIGGAFALVAAIIIATAVRIVVFARREEISIMRLVGATDGFIRRPFLTEGVLTGFLGGVLAIGLTWAAFRTVNATLMGIFWIPAQWAVIGVASGALLGFLSSAIAVRRHLRAV